MTRGKKAAKGILDAALFVRLPQRLREEMQREGAKLGLSMSDIARLRMMRPCPDPAAHGGKT